MTAFDDQWAALGDELGPSKVVLLREPTAELRAIVVVDNVACGPAIGGVRMAADVTVAEVARLARAMTHKNAMAGLPHGGAKAGIVADPKMDPLGKERLVRAFARAMAELESYIPGPDMGTDEACMAWVRDEIGRAVGLPRVVGGIPLDEIGATGFGVAVCATVAGQHAGLSLDGARVAIQGCGAVGRHAARQLAERGAKIVAAADTGGAVHHPEGLDVDALLAHKGSGRSIHRFGGGKPMAGADIVSVDCDVLVPAARPDVLTADNADAVRARLVISGANIPATAEAERRLHERGVLVVPDFVANAGGVICAAVEYHGGTRSQAFATIEEKIADNTRAVLERARQSRVAPREAAVRIAEERVREAMSYRRHGLRPRSHLELDL